MYLCTVQDGKFSVRKICKIFVISIQATIYLCRTPSGNFRMYRVCKRFVSSDAKLMPMQARMYLCDIPGWRIQNVEKCT